MQREQVYKPLTLSRRQWISAAGAGIATSVAGCLSSDGVPTEVEVLNREITFFTDTDHEDTELFASGRVYLKAPESWTDGTYSATLRIGDEDASTLSVDSETARQAVEAGEDFMELARGQRAEFRDRTDQGDPDAVEMDDEDFFEDVVVATVSSQVEQGAATSIELHDDEGSVSKCPDVTSEWPAPYRTASNSGINSNLSLHRNELFVRDRWSYPEPSAVVGDASQQQPLGCVVSNSRLYLNMVGLDDSTPVSGAILALDLDDGDADWTANPHLDTDETDATHFSWLSVRDGRVYTATADGETTVVYAFDATDGSVIWEQSVDKGWGRTWLTATDDAVYAAATAQQDNGLVALSPDTGSVQTDRETGGPVLSRDDRLIVAESATQLLATDSSFETEHWTYRTPQGYGLVKHRTSATDDYVFVQLREFENRSETFMAVLDAEDGTQLNEDDSSLEYPGYQLTSGSGPGGLAASWQATPAIATELSGSDVGLSYSETHGIQLFQMDSVGSASGSQSMNAVSNPLVLGNYVYFVDPDDVLNATRLTEQLTRDQVGRVELESPLASETALVYADQTIYAACEDAVVAVAASAPEEAELIGFQSVHRPWVIDGIPEL